MSPPSSMLQHEEAGSLASSLVEGEQLTFDTDCDEAKASKPAAAGKESPSAVEEKLKQAIEQKRKDAIAKVMEKKKAELANAQPADKV